MFTRLLLIFIGIPFLEMMILIKLGEAFGFWSALLLIIGTGFLGASLARIQGLRAWNAIQDELRAGNMPGEKMLDGLLILIAGIMLITPGLLTDLAGIALLIPWTRNLFKGWLRRKFDLWLRSSNRQPGQDAGFRVFIE